MTKPVRIGVFGHYGNKNLGDEAIVAAVIQNLRLRIPNVELEGLSINPIDTEKRHGIPSFPIRYREQYFSKSVRDTPDSTPSPQSTNNQQTSTKQAPNSIQIMVKESK